MYKSYKYRIYPNKTQERELSRRISDQGWRIFRDQLNYKTQWYGSKLIVINRFLPTSKICSSCGSIKDHLSLDTRIYKCDHCGLEIDRDLNAAINIRSAGILADSKRESVLTNVLVCKLSDTVGSTEQLVERSALAFKSV